MKKSNKELICRQLAFFWLVVILGFLALQTAYDLVSPQKNQAVGSQSEWVLAASHHAPVADLTPDLKFIQDWFQHDFFVCGFNFSAISRPGIVFYTHFKIELIRLLQTSISINAP